jgi:hypothetical protein
MFFGNYIVLLMVISIFSCSSDSDMKNEKWCINVEKSDLYNDGSVDFTHKYYYNSKALIERKETYTDNNIPVESVNYIYDSNDNVIEEKTELAIESTDNIRKLTFRYNENNQKIIGELDLNNDGITDFKYSYFYDNVGRIRRKEMCQDGNTLPISITEYFYIENTEIIKAVHPNGEVYLITKITYDERNNYSKREEDSNADGITDDSYIYSYTYDTYGNVLTKLECEDSPDEPFPSCNLIINEWIKI